HQWGTLRGRRRGERGSGSQETCIPGFRPITPSDPKGPDGHVGALPRASLSRSRWSAGGHGPRRSRGTRRASAVCASLPSGEQRRFSSAACRRPAGSAPRCPVTVKGTSMRKFRPARAHLGPCRPAGFTLIELLVVIAIIAILAAVLFPVFAQA